MRMDDFMTGHDYIYIYIDYDNFVTTKENLLTKT